MRNHLWLLSAFSVAASLSLGVTAAEAKKASKSYPVASGLTAYDINTKGCNFPPPNPDQKWEWPNARLAVQFIQQADGSYKIKELLGAKNPDEKLPIASVTKMMTALVIFDLVDQGKINLDKMIPVTKESLCLMQDDNRFAVKGLPAGITQINGHHAMGQLIKKSSNTMAVNLAIAGAGSVEKFVALMNAKAKVFEMNNTHFINPHGLPEGDRKSEYSTARDLAKMALHIRLQMERFKKYETAPLQTWILAEEPHPNKQKLIDLGAVFKPGTIRSCANLLAVVEEGATIELCGTTATRYQIANSVIRTIKTASNKIGKMLISPAMAEDTVPKPPNSADVSLLPTHPSMP